MPIALLLMLLGLALSRGPRRPVWLEYVPANEPLWSELVSEE